MPRGPIPPPNVLNNTPPVAGAFVMLHEDNVGALKLSTRVNDPELTPTVTRKDCLPWSPTPDDTPLDALQAMLLCDVHSDAEQDVAAENAPEAPDCPTRALWL